jgi:hypothetical protein
MNTNRKKLEGNTTMTVNFKEANTNTKSLNFSKFETFYVVGQPYY